MKKLLFLSLIVLAMVCVFAGCTGTASTMNGRNTTGYSRNDNSNVSTSRDGTVNGRNRSNMPGMGIDVEIGSGVR